MACSDVSTCVRFLAALVLVCTSCEPCRAGPTLSASATRVYGPGIHPKRSNLPINYFYIQAVATDGTNYTAVTDGTFVISFESDQDGQRTRLRSSVLNLNGGLLLYQYRVHSDYRWLKISVFYNGQHVAHSPYKVGPVLHENCACPLRTQDEWLEDFSCSEADEQILEDLESFKANGGINITDLYDRAGELFSSHSFIHYSIVDSKLYAQKFGSITGFKFLSDMILLSFVNKAHLPDMELIVNLGDWPLNKVSRMPAFPVFSWCGSPDTRDIVWPTWDLMKSSVMGMDRVSLTTLSVQKTRGDPWSERIHKAYFRGRDSTRERLELVKLHRKDTEMFVVGITNWFFFPYDEEVYGPKASHVSFHDFFKYKYQINMDGTVAAYRFPYLMGGGSLIIKQDSAYYEHFYRHLNPWVHYVPVHRDISDLVERVGWARENDDESRQIAANAYQFLVDRLLPDQLYCYIMQLLRLYSILQVGTPIIHPGMEPVEPEVPHDCSSVCKKLSSEAKTKDRDEL